MQKLSRRQHGFTDYSYIPTVLAAPRLAGFEDNETAVRMTRVAAGAIVLSSLFTRAEWGLVRVMPYRTHLALDAANGLFQAAAPWLFGFADDARARNTFLAMGVVGLLAGTLSRPNDEMLADAPVLPEALASAADHR